MSKDNKDQIRPYYLSWLEDMRVDEVGYILLSSILFAREGDKIFYFLSHRTHVFPICKGEFSVAVRRTGDLLWEIDLSLSYERDNMMIVAPVSVDDIKRKKTYGPFVFHDEIVRYDISHPDVRYDGLLYAYSTACSGDDISLIDTHRENICAYLEEYLKTSTRLHQLHSKYSFFLQWEEADERVASHLEELLKPYIREYARGDVRLNFEFLDVLEEARHEEHWECFVQELSTESMELLAEYELVDLQRELSELEEEVASLKELGKDDFFMEKVSNWYNDFLLPVYQRVWERLQSTKRKSLKIKKLTRSDEGGARYIWERFMHARERMSIVDLDQLLDKLVQEEAYDEAAEVRDEIKNRTLLGESGVARM